jgi:hypothetical protein
MAIKARKHGKLLRLKGLLIQYEISNTDLSILLHATISTVSRVLNGGRDISLNEMRIIQAAVNSRSGLNLTIDDIFN